MTYLLDTNILVRLANTSDRFHAATIQAILTLHRRQEVLQITPQILIEFRSVATRPIAVNGLGLSSQNASSQSAQFESIFPLLIDQDAIFPIWQGLVEALEVTGKQVHDARLVAVCFAHQVSHLLTFNTQHFDRLSTYGEGLSVVSPDAVRAEGE